MPHAALRRRRLRRGPRGQLLLSLISAVLISYRSDSIAQLQLLSRRIVLAWLFGRLSVVPRMVLQFGNFHVIVEPHLARLEDLQRLSLDVSNFLNMATLLWAIGEILYRLLSFWPFAMPEEALGADASLPLIISCNLIEITLLIIRNLGAFPLFGRLLVRSDELLRRVALVEDQAKLLDLLDHVVVAFGTFQSRGVPEQLVLHLRLNSLDIQVKFLCNLLPGLLRTDTVNEEAGAPQRMHLPVQRKAEPRLAPDILI